MSVDVVYSGGIVEVVSPTSVVEVVTSNDVVQIDSIVPSIALYDGAYIADALFTDQSFATKAKMMKHDFSVRAINYTEAQNDYGITVTIGG